MIFLFACGGSGGHIFPALATAEELESRGSGHQVYFIGGTKDIESAIFKPVPKERFFSVASAAYRGGRSLVDPRFLIKLARGFFQSRRILNDLQPALVVGFGGYVSFPVLVAAMSLGIRATVHEQNARPGRANRWLARWTGSAALSYAESASYFGTLKQMRVTGNPIRAAIETDRRAEALDRFDFEPGRLTLMVLGGSQGAESVNRIFLESLAFWSVEMKTRIQVLHLCGKMSPDQAERACREQGVASRAYAFFDRMDLAYSAADFCIGRAGATFLAEIAYRGIPSVLVPYPHGDGHQRDNAKIFSRNHPALVEEQASLTPVKLTQDIQYWFDRLCNQKESFAKKPSGNARVQCADFFEFCAT